MPNFDFLHSQNVGEISIQMSDSFSSNLQAHPRPFKNSLLSLLNSEHPRSQNDRISRAESSDHMLFPNHGSVQSLWQISNGYMFREL